MQVDIPDDAVEAAAIRLGLEPWQMHDFIVDFSTSVLGGALLPILHLAYIERVSRQIDHPTKRRKGTHRNG